MSYADIQKLQSLQSIGKSQSSETGAFVLRNDLQAAWERVSSLKNARIDVVLDNGVLQDVQDSFFTPQRYADKNSFPISGYSMYQAGFEVGSTNLVLSMSIGITQVSSVVHRSRACRLPRHAYLFRFQSCIPVRESFESRAGVSQNNISPKLLPWFVSDVLPTDFRLLLSPFTLPSTNVSEATSSSWTSFFSASSNSTQEESGALEKLLARWRYYLADGTFMLSVPFDSPLGAPKARDTEQSLKDAAFWTTGSSYWCLPEQEGLMKHLLDSGLVIFKGDLKCVNLRCFTSRMPDG